MAKEATLQVRMDTDLKEEAEKLYRDMGTSLAEAVRIFAKQSVLQGGMPFPILYTKTESVYGKLSKYADKQQREQEEDAFEKAMVKKHAEAD